VYGRNLNEELIKEVLRTCRTQLSKKITLKTRENITKEEIDALADKYVS
jgi:tRNA-dihydrouridine synthase